MISVVISARNAALRGLAQALRRPGLLIPRQLFDAVGGYKNLPMMEDIDLARRLGRSRLVMLDATAVISAEHHKQDVYLLRSTRNQLCQALYGAGFPMRLITRLYGKMEMAP